MSDTTAPALAVPDKSLVARFVGVIVSPRETFEAVAARPRWLVMAIVIVVLTAVPTMWFQNTTVGRQATLDETVRKTEALIGPLSDQVYEGIRKGIMEPSPARIALSAVSMFVVFPIIWAAIAGVAMGIFGVFMGGTGSFKQAFAAVVHSNAVGVVGALIITPVNYVRESMSSATNLAVLLPFLPDGSFLARLFGMVDLFTVWWFVVLAIGLGVVFKKKTSTVAVVVFGIYAVIAIAIAAFMAARS
jgi:hypothetical protein